MKQPAKLSSITLQQTSNRQSFRKLSGCLAMALFTLGIHAASHAAVFTENFNTPFPNWEAGVFGSNTNARNYYCGGLSGCANRGNNPDGLYVIDPSASTSINVSFNSLFGNSLTAFSLDVAAFSATALQVFDSNNVMIFNADVTLTAGAFTLPGDYVNYVINSTTGISRFSFTGTSSGNTSIDNLVLTTLDAAPLSQVPEPGTLGLFGLGLLGCVARHRRSAGRKSRLHAAVH